MKFTIKSQIILNTSPLYQKLLFILYISKIFYCMNVIRGSYILLDDLFEVHSQLSRCIIEHVLFFSFTSVYFYLLLFLRMRLKNK